LYCTQRENPTTRHLWRYLILPICQRMWHLCMVSIQLQWEPMILSVFRVISANSFVPVLWSDLRYIRRRYKQKWKDTDQHQRKVSIDAWMQNYNVDDTSHTLFA
jgi:hypothetical protein